MDVVPDIRIYITVTPPILRKHADKFFEEKSVTLLMAALGKRILLFQNTMPLRVMIMFFIKTSK